MEIKLMLNQEKIKMYNEGKIGVSYFAGYVASLVKQIDPEINTNVYGVYYKSGQRADIGRTYEPLQFFDRLPATEIQTSQFVKKFNEDAPLTDSEYDQGREVALRMFELCESDLLLTFKVLKKLIRWSKVEALRIKYINAALVLTEIYLTGNEI